MRIVSTAESVLAWIERIERSQWGKQLIALIFAGLWMIWAWVTANVPPALIVGIGAILFFALLWGQDRGQAWLKDKLGPPITIQARGYSINHNTAGRTEDQRRMRVISGPLHVLNRSKSRHVSLSFDVVTVYHRDRERLPWSVSGGLFFSEGFKTNLGAEEETEGVWTMMVPHLEPLNDIDNIAFTIVDRLSKRTAILRIPGDYPPTVEWPYRKA